MRRWTQRIGLLVLAGVVLSAAVGCHSHRNKYRHYRYDDDCRDRRPSRDCYSEAPAYHRSPYAHDSYRPGAGTHLSWEAREWIAAQRGSHWRR